MTPEEYERIKAAEKEHLRKLKKLKDAHRQLERQAKVTRAVTDMTSSMQEKLDVHSDMMDRIATESAINEARLEMAIESRAHEDLETHELEDELELAKAKARDLIRRLKEESDEPVASKPESSTSTGSRSKPAKESAKSDPSPAPEEKPTDDLPEKTIGRMKPGSP